MTTTKELAHKIIELREKNMDEGYNLIVFRYFSFDHAAAICAEYLKLVKREEILRNGLEKYKHLISHTDSNGDVWSARQALAEADSIKGKL